MDYPQTVKDNMTTWSIPEAIKMSWLGMLRFGKYKQGKGRLYRAETDCFCVLGLLMLASGVTREEMSETSSPVFLDPAVKLRINFDVDCRFYLFSGVTECSLINLNDTQMLTFEEIAYWVDNYVTTSESLS